MTTSQTLPDGRVARNYYQTIREGDHQHIWAPESVNKTFQSLRTVQEVHTEHNHYVTIKNDWATTLLWKSR